MNLRILIGLFLIVVFVFFHIFHMYKWNIIFEDQSDYQTIELVERNSEFALLLNGNIQVHSNEYEISHKLQCSVPIEKFKPKNILILGGGDLIAARFCLEDKNVEKVTICEIDEKVVNFAKRNDIFKRITNNVSKDKRLDIVIGDAIEYVNNINQSEYDLIIEDVEIDFTNQLSKVNRGSFLMMCLNKSRVFSGTVPDHNFANLDASEDFKSVANYNKINVLKQIGFEQKDIDVVSNQIKDRNMEICVRDHGHIYGKEAYIIIHK